MWSSGFEVWVLEFGVRGTELVWVLGVGVSILRIGV